MLPILSVGPLAIPLAPLSILLGVWLGLSLAERHAPRFGVNANHLYNLAAIGLLSALVGARLSYAARYPAIFTADPLGLLSLSPELLDPLGGLVAGVLAAMIYGQRKSLSLWSTLDALTPALAILLLALTISHLASGAAFGQPADLPWSIDLWGVRRHPAQLYEALAATAILLMIWPGRGFLGSTPLPGSLFLRFLALSAGARLVLEAFRGDSTLLPGGLRLAQVVAWLVLAVVLWVLGKRR